MALLELNDVKCHFKAKKSLVRAVDGVSIAIDRGETLAIVGESGCGKSTLAKSILGLVPVKEGHIRFAGESLENTKSQQYRNVRRRIQAVFQDPYSSLNPRLKIRSILMEPLTANGFSRKAAQLRADEVLDLVGLPLKSQDLYPHEFSGGQRQRVAIARALTLKPDLILLDEPISALDVSIRAQILNLLQDLQAELKLTYLLIAHDLALVEQASDRVGVMYLGKIVEMGLTQEIFSNPLHPYTQALLAAVPQPDPTIPRNPGLVKGDVASATRPPSGCRFHPRCHRAIDTCSRNVPALDEVKVDQESLRQVACDLVETRAN